MIDSTADLLKYLLSILNEWYTVSSPKLGQRMHMFPEGATYPILNVGGCEKLNPPPGAPVWGAMGGLAAGVGEAAEPTPKVNTPEVLFVDPNALAPPN